MWLHHLINFIGRAVSIFFDAIGTTILGLLIDLVFAGSIAAAVLLKKRKSEGWLAMLSHFRTEYRQALKFSVLCSLVLYGPVVIWSLGKAVYADHEYMKGVAGRFRQANATLSAPQTPHLIGSLEHGVAIAPWNAGTMITMQPYISNDGAPSIAKDFSIIAHFTNGRVETGKYYPPPPEGGFYTFGTKGEKPGRVYEDDFLEKKAVATPITQANVATGVLMRTFKTRRDGFKHGTVIELVFQDVKGHPYSVTFQIDKWRTGW